ncbi:PREDICTED: leucine-rich repeat extensin-like protein 1 [Branchiostoma belcheri]|uniref:Leucine-rich repeat extensin-like protein 1 n=1 Tax=Branchiostoma belcheri TaxID=7741 RepID=A0A6P4YHK3_BRABE|nr:PREDICTED: leucine-rich repeat extensin-like protein 1 [Branchiostoma belcheri]
MASPTQTGLPPRFPSPASFPPAVPSQPPPPGTSVTPTIYTSQATAHPSLQPGANTHPPRPVSQIDRQPPPPGTAVTTTVYTSQATARPSLQPGANTHPPRPALRYGSTTHPPRHPQPPQTTRPTLPGQPPSYRYYAPTDPAAGLPVTWYQPPAVPSPSSPPHLKTPLPAAFLGNGDEDFPVWLTKFEVYADAHLYDATVRTRALPTFLDGPALTYFQSLPQETNTTTRHLCQALSHAFSQDKYIFSFQQSLAQRKRQPGESLIVFASELKHLVRRAHRTYK